jgi:hypothetical protein
MVASLSEHAMHVRTLEYSLEAHGINTAHSIHSAQEITSNNIIVMPSNAKGDI